MMQKGLVVENIFGDYIVLDEKYSGMYLDKKISFKDLIGSKSQLKLYFNLVGTLRREDDNDNSDLEFTNDQLNKSEYFLPYLEYQILTDEPIADSKPACSDGRRYLIFIKHRTGKELFPVTTQPFVLGNL